MSISFRQREPSTLEYLSRSLGQGLGAGVQTSLQQRMQQAQEAKKQQQRKTQFNEVLSKLPKGSITPREEALLELSYVGGNEGSAITQLLKPPPVVKSEKPAPLTPFQKTQQNLAAKEYEKLIGEIPKLQSGAENIKYMRQLSSELGGPLGEAKALIGTEKAKEFDSLGLAAVEPILKIFNPVGAIPVAKINIIRSQFSPKASDLQTTINGKLNALERLNNQALKRAEERVALYEAYDGMPPASEITKFDKDSEKIIDQVIKEQKTVNKSNEGKTEKGLVSGYISTKDGRRIKPLPQDQIADLEAKGLIKRG